MCRGKQTHLWSWEHVQAPGTHFTISRDGDEVMSILGPYNIYTVHGMLQNINMEDQTLIQEEMLPFEYQAHYSKTRIKEWHNPTIIWASGHLPLLIWTWFLSKSSGSNIVVEILTKLHLAQSDAMQSSWRKLEQRRIDEQMQGREVNLDYLTESPPPRLAYKLTVSNRKSQFSKGWNYWLLEGTSVTKSRV